jgi:hypothetical protein
VLSVELKSAAKRVAACTLPLLTHHGQRAEADPARPIRLIVASAPGAAPEILARIVAQKLSDDVGQQVVIGNRAGASGEGAVPVGGTPREFDAFIAAERARPGNGIRKAGVSLGS